jgi:enoyl-CoA hydratase
MTFADGNILASRRVPVTTIVINRTEHKNSLDAKTARGLAGAFQIADADEEVRAVVVTGAGGAFCTGADLKQLSDGDAYFPWADGLDGPLAMPLSKPVIAAVEGPAFAEGLGLALYCDIRIVDDSAVFAAASRQWGVVMGDGTTVRLPRLIGMGRALDMVLTGRHVGADEAVTMGLASRKVPRTTTRAEAEKLALRLAELPQAALLADRQSVYQGFDQASIDALRREVEVARSAYGPDTRVSVAKHAQGAASGIRLLRA